LESLLRRDVLEFGMIDPSSLISTLNLSLLLDLEVLVLQVFLWDLMLLSRINEVFMAFQILSSTVKGN
jgi:hypothetical protein